MQLKPQTRFLMSVLVPALGVCAHAGQDAVQPSTPPADTPTERKAADSGPDATVVVLPERVVPESISPDGTDQPAQQAGEKGRLAHVRPVDYSHVELIGCGPARVSSFFWAEGFEDAYRVSGSMRVILAQVWETPMPKSDDAPTDDVDTDEDDAVDRELLALDDPLDVLGRWNPGVIERSKLSELRVGGVSDMRSAARWELGDGWDIGAAGEERPLHNEESYYAISAETQVRVAPQAEFRFGYDVLRKGVPGVLDDLDVSNEGMFLKFQWRF